MEAEAPPVGWQSSPDRRGTLTIIENSLFTILACTWSIQHLNVPKLGEEFWPTLLRKCKWTVITVFFPEFIMAHAILEFVMALENMRELDSKGLLDDNLPWFFRLCRSSHANSRDVETGHEKPPSVSEDARQQVVKWTLTHCYFANMGGFYISHPTGPDSARWNNRLLTAGHFAKNWQHIKIPELSEDDLKDKSKTDYFTKAIAVIQIAQLFLSLIFRGLRHLAFSQLETVTLAFAVCGVLTYGCSWYKPQGVNRPIPVSLRLPGGSSEGFNPEQRTSDSLWQIVSNSNPKENTTLERIPNDNIPRTKANETHYALYVLTVLTAGFGSIHAVAWNFEFPTPAEKLLWKVATLVSTIAPPVALLAIPLSQILRSWGNISDFRNTCLNVVREYSWHVADNRKALDAMKILREICDSPETVEPKHYKDILGADLDSGTTLGEEILEYIQQDRKFEQCLPKAFLPKFKKLLGILEGKSDSKKLWEAARTNAYPKHEVFGPRINTGIIYITAIVYCFARLSIIGVAFSSLRRMPDSVYRVTWTTNIPAVQ